MHLIRFEVCFGGDLFVLNGLVDDQYVLGEWRSLGMMRWRRMTKYGEHVGSGNAMVLLIMKGSEMGEKIEEEWRKSDLNCSFPQRVGQLSVSRQPRFGRPTAN